MPMNWNGPIFVDAIEARAAGAVIAVADQVLARAKAECPVDTEALRKSGHVEPGPDPTVAYVVFDVPYAAPVHFGNGRNVPNPFLGRAVALERDDAERVMRERIGAKV